MTGNSEQIPRDDDARSRPLALPQHHAIGHELAAARALSIDGEYQLIADSIPQLVWRAGPDGTIDYLSEQWYVFTGVSRPEPLRLLSLHQDWKSVIHAEDAAAFMERWAQSVESGSRFEAECRIHRAGSGYCWHLCRAVPVRDRHSRILSWFGTSTYNDKEKREREDMANASQAKDRFLAMLAHELRTPLTPAMLIVAELEADAALPAHLRERVGVLRRNIQAEAHLVGDLADISAATHGKLPLHLAAVDLHDVVRHALDVCRADLSAKAIAVSLVLGAPHSIVIGDAIRLQQMIWNLLKNAAKFTPAGGHVEIGSAEAAECMVRLWVKDDGIGIDSEMIDGIFKPFDQGPASTARRFGGMGLGLAIARTIAELHQGSLIGVSAGEGQGTTFVMEIPLLPHHRIAVEATSSGSGAETPASKPLAILLVEDHADTARAMARLLASFGHKVEIASTAAAALAQAAALPFDLVISDIELPDKSGWDFVRELHAVSSIPAIALTGFATRDSAARSLEAGFSGHLVKPVDVEALRTSISDAVTPREPGAAIRA